MLLVLHLPEEDVAPYEWTEEGKGYREFLVPADLLNRYGIAERWLIDDEWPVEWSPRLLELRRQIGQKSGRNRDSGPGRP